MDDRTSQEGAEGPNPEASTPAANTDEASTLLLERLRKLANLTTALIDRFGAGREEDPRGILLHGSATPRNVELLQLTAMQTLTTGAVLWIESHELVPAGVRQELADLITDKTARSTAEHVELMTSFVARIAGAETKAPMQETRH